MAVDRAAWDRRYDATDLVWSDRPNRFLVDETVGLAPGRALDVACGEGRNAVWLAHRGWAVTGADFSPVAIGKARRLATAHGVEATFVEAERLSRDRLVLGVVGDITAAELAPLLKATFGGLPAAAPASVAETVPAAAGDAAIIDMDVPQSAIAFGQGGLKRDDPRFYALTVLNQILGGGGLTSRLFDEVREKRGLVYSVYTGLVPLDRAALILGGAGTANERVAETIQVIREQWRRLASEGVYATELADSKTYLTGSFPLRFSGSGRIAGLLVSVQLDNLGIDYLDRRNGLIEAVTLDDVNALARDLLAPNKLTFIIVGQPSVDLPAR